MNIVSFSKIKKVQKSLKTTDISKNSSKSGGRLKLKI